jgi:hypothetical protein
LKLVKLFESARPPLRSFCRLILFWLDMITTWYLWIAVSLIAVAKETCYLPIRIQLPESCRYIGGKPLPICRVPRKGVAGGCHDQGGVLRRALSVCLRIFVKSQQSLRDRRLPLWPSLFVQVVHLDWSHIFQ